MSTSTQFSAYSTDVFLVSLIKAKLFPCSVGAKSRIAFKDVTSTSFGNWEYRISWRNRSAQANHPLRKWVSISQVVHSRHYLTSLLLSDLKAIDSECPSILPSKRVDVLPAVRTSGRSWTQGNLVRAVEYCQAWLGQAKLWKDFGSKRLLMALKESLSFEFPSHIISLQSEYALE